MSKSAPRMAVPVPPAPAPAPPKTITVVSIGRNSDGRYLLVEGDIEVSKLRPIGAAGEYATVMRAYLRESAKRHPSTQIAHVGGLLVSKVYAP